MPTSIVLPGVKVSVKFRFSHANQVMSNIIIRKFITRTCSQALSMNRRRTYFLRLQLTLLEVPSLALCLSSLTSVPLSLAVLKLRGEGLGPTF